MSQPMWPQQGYPAAPAMPQYPAQPAAPQFPAQQQQFVAPPAYPVAQPQYPQQFAPPAQPLARGSLDDFYSQPSAGGGKALTFEQVGVSYIGIVSRPITSGDIQQQTDTRGTPQTFRDGRPKFVMKVPLQMQPGPAYPDGQATWYVKGQARDELVRAMAEAGAPAGPPEAGAIIQITHTGTRSSGPGMNPAKLFQVVYKRPDGAAPVAAEQAPAPQPAPPAAPAVAQAPIPQQAPTQPSAFTQLAQQQGITPPVPAAPTQPAAPAVPQAPAPAAPQPPADLSAEQQALLAKLTGQQA